MRREPGTPAGDVLRGVDLEHDVGAFGWEARLRAHADDGRLALGDDPEQGARVAALAFISPIMLALIHQHELAGCRCRPLDLEAFARDHTAKFLAGWAPAKPARRR